jgi:hypothetical protein
LTGDCSARSWSMTAFRRNAISSTRLTISHSFMAPSRPAGRSAVWMWVEEPAVRFQAPVVRPMLLGAGDQDSALRIRPLPRVQSSGHHDRSSIRRRACSVRWRPEMKLGDKLLMAYPEKMVEAIILGLVDPLNQHLVKLVAFEFPAELGQHFAKEASSWLNKIQRLRMKPTRRTGSVKFYFDHLFDYPFGGTRPRRCKP